eukprot:gene5932-biopygen14848
MRSCCDVPLRANTGVFERSLLPPPGPAVNVRNHRGNCNLRPLGNNNAPNRSLHIQKHSIHRCPLTVYRCTLGRCMDRCVPQVVDPKALPCGSTVATGKPFFCSASLAAVRWTAAGKEGGGGDAPPAQFRRASGNDLDLVHFAVASGKSIQETALPPTFTPRMDLKGSRDSRWKARLLPELIRIIGPHFTRVGCGSHRGMVTYLLYPPNKSGFWGRAPPPPAGALVWFVLLSPLFVFLWVGVGVAAWEGVHPWPRVGEFVGRETILAVARPGCVLLALLGGTKRECCYNIVTSLVRKWHHARINTSRKFHTRHTAEQPAPHQGHAIPDTGAAETADTQ